MREQPVGVGNGNLMLRFGARGSTAEVALAGDLDMAAAFSFETRLDAVLAAPDVKALALDLGEVAFVDSAGIGALLALRERAAQLGVDLAVTHVSANVRRVLDLTGLHTLARTDD